MRSNQTTNPKKSFKTIIKFLVLLTFIGTIFFVIVFIKKYSIDFSITKKHMTSTTSNQSDAASKKTTIKDDNMNVFYPTDGNLRNSLAKDKINMTKVDALMKIFKSTTIITAYSEQTPLTLGAICLPNIIDGGVAAEMIRRLNNSPSITTKFEKGADIIIPMIN